MAPPSRTVLGDELRARRGDLLSRQAVHRILGFRYSQRKNLPDQGKCNTPNRPELIIAAARTSGPLPTRFALPAKAWNRNGTRG